MFAANRPGNVHTPGDNNSYSLRNSNIFKSYTPKSIVRSA